jgi:hypothetical protein
MRVCSTSLVHSQNARYAAETRSSVTVRFLEKGGIFMQHVVSRPSCLLSGLLTQSKIEQLLEELYSVELNGEELETPVYQPTSITELRLEAMEDVGLSTLMDDALVLVTKELEVEYSEIFELQADGQSLLLRSGKGWEEGLIGQATVELDSPSGYALEAKKPMVFEDILSEPRLSVPPLLCEHGVKSCARVIISNQEQQPIRILGADATEPRAFSEEDTTFLQSIAEVLAEVR